MPFRARQIEIPDEELPEPLPMRSEVTLTTANPKRDLWLVARRIDREMARLARPESCATRPRVKLRNTPTYRWHWDGDEEVHLNLSCRTVCAEYADVEYDVLLIGGATSEPLPEPSPEPEKDWQELWAEGRAELTASSEDEGNEGSEDDEDTEE